MGIERETEAIWGWACRQDAPGSFVDVGAALLPEAPWSMTTQLAFAGWQGICIEPAPDRAAELGRYYAGLENVLVCPFGLTVDADKTRPLFWTPGGWYSSFDYHRAAGMAGQGNAPIPLVIATLHPSDLANIWRELPEPVFLNIDAEGYTLTLWEMLRSWIPATCVCLEAENDEDRDKALSLLEGWHVLTATGENIVAEYRGPRDKVRPAIPGIESMLADRTDR